MVKSRIYQMSMRHSFHLNAFVSFSCSPQKKENKFCCCCWHFVVCSLLALLQDGGNGWVTSPEARWLKGLEGGVGDWGEAQRSACHPRDIIEAAWLLIARGYMKMKAEITAALWRVIHVSKWQSPHSCFNDMLKSWNVRNMCCWMNSFVLWQRCTLEWANINIFL